MEKLNNYIVETRDVYETKLKFKPVAAALSVGGAILGGLGLILAGTDVLPAIGTSCLVAAVASLLTGWEKVTTNKIIGKQVKVRLNQMTFDEYSNLAKDDFARTSSLVYNEKTGEFFIWGYIME